MSDTYRFKSTDTTYCYPGTSVLRNKLGIVDQEELLKAETSLVSLMMSSIRDRPVAESFDTGSSMCNPSRTVLPNLFVGWVFQDRGYLNRVPVLPS